MKPPRALLLIIFTATAAGLGFYHQTRSGTTEYVETMQSSENSAPPRTSEDAYSGWKRPPGPPKVALQVGHWKNQELPDEFENLRRTGGGTSGGGKAEWEVSLVIAELTADLLRAEGITVELLPATIPPDYWADALVSIHEDGNTNSSVSGYKVAAPWRDRTGKADQLASLIEEEYGKVVDLPLDPNVSRNMRGYYAFNWRRYEHSMHPMTVGTIVETGFLTNPYDRSILINQPELSARGIANGIIQFLRLQNIGAANPYSTSGTFGAIGDISNPSGSSTNS